VCQARKIEEQCSDVEAVRLQRLIHHEHQNVFAGVPILGEARVNDLLKPLEVELDRDSLERERLRALQQQEKQQQVVDGDNVRKTSCSLGSTQATNATTTGRATYAKCHQFTTAGR
jgi:hypothetical protein